MKPPAHQELTTLNRYVLTLCAGWAILVAVSCLLFARAEEQRMVEVALSIARSSHDKDLAYRMWNSMHGGVYVPVTEKTQPNPYLEAPDRDVTTTGGLRLTMVNPAYMTRQVHELSKEHFGIKGHITSLTPIRPANAPDEWEAKALNRILAQRLTEYHEVLEESGQQSLRYIKPLLTAEPCLKCHAKQGYKVGDIRGGIGVTVPMDFFADIVRPDMTKVLFLHTSILVMGLTIILLGRWLLSIQIVKRIALFDEASAARLAADKANRAKSMFLATMSHEIRTPLNGIMGMLQIAREGRLAPDQRECLDVALGSSRNLMAILNDFLDLARIESGRMHLVQEQINVPVFFQLFQSMFGMQARQKGLSFDMELDPGLPETLVADEGKLRQVLFNLLGNAVKFTSSGSVSLRVSMIGPPNGDRPGRLLLAVGDTGPGIPDEELNSIFTPFTQVDSSSTRQYGGTGLGLSIVHRLVRLMGGEICVASEPGQGTTFFIVLPLTQASPRPAADSDPHAPAALPGGAEPSMAPPDADQSKLAPPASYAILVVDDDPVNRAAALGLLRAMGHKPTGAQDGEEGVSACLSAHFDLVLTDVEMPGADGIETARRIRDLAGGRDKAPPILAFTAHAMAGDRERLLARGFDGYVAKPADKQELAKAIEKAMAGRGAA
jgi:signal transduction histidine kinase/ActR/RegA family two-component response regulator